MSSRPALGALLLAVACGPLTEAVDTEVCASGTRWIGGDSGDPEMKPGGDCIDCHRRADGPMFTFAGTVYEDLRQDTDCFGTPGVTVKITDADGRVFSAGTNAAGNFQISGSAEMPYTASVMIDGQEFKMLTPQTNGDCNSCHTRDGVNMAAGRIFVTQ